MWKGGGRSNHVLQKPAKTAWFLTETTLIEKKILLNFAFGLRQPKILIQNEMKWDSGLHQEDGHSAPPPSFLAFHLFVKHFVP